VQASKLLPPPPTSTALVSLRLGNAIVELPVSGTAEDFGRVLRSGINAEPHPPDFDLGTSQIVEPDLSVVQTRSRLKAASCRLYIKRRALPDGSDAEYESRSQMNQMITQAKALPECFLWAFWRERSLPGDAEIAQIADNYDAHADAAALMLRVDGFASGNKSDDESAALQLLAEANSALRSGLASTWLVDDIDQFDAHLWLRRQTALRRVFVSRHMTVDDPADPSNADNLRKRVADMTAKLDARVVRSRGVKNAIGQIRYHAGKVARNRSEDVSRDWTKIGEVVANLATMGVSATDRRIAEAVGNEAAALWTAESTNTPGISAVIERLRSLAASEQAAAALNGSETSRAWSSAVLQVRSRLRGKRIVIIGGARNGPAVDRFIDAFQVVDAEWVELLEHGPGGPMKAPIGWPDTAVVIVIIKLTGHLHADEARALAALASKPLVVLTGGYNPEQVAKAILEQASARLV